MLKQLLQLCIVIILKNSQIFICASPMTRLDFDASLQFTLANLTAIGPWGEAIFIFLDGLRYLRVPQDRLGPLQLNLTGLVSKDTQKDMMPLEDKTSCVD